MYNNFGVFTLGGKCPWGALLDMSNSQNSRWFKVLLFATLQESIASLKLKWPHIDYLCMVCVIDQHPGVHYIQFSTKNHCRGQWLETISIPNHSKNGKSSYKHVSVVKPSNALKQNHISANQLHSVKGNYEDFVHLLWRVRC